MTELGRGRTQVTGEISTAAGYVHEIGFYASDEEFRDLICPFALGGLEACEPVVFAYDPYKMDLLRRWLPSAPGIIYVTDTGPYAAPAKALCGWRKLVEGHLAAGAPRVRIAGNVPHPGYGRPYAGWDRYEAAIDKAMGDLPVWAPCLYDTRIAPAEVLETASQRHHHILDRNGRHRANDAFSPTESLVDFLLPPIDPLETTSPALELVNPEPGEARAVVARLAQGRISDNQHGDLLLALSEAVTNAVLHGVQPISVRVWLGAGEMVIGVHDSGRGPRDPLVGLLPKGDDSAESGRGLWITHQLDIDVALIPGADGFTVRLRAGSWQSDH